MQLNRKFFRHIGVLLSATLVTLLSACDQFESKEASKDIQRVPLSALALVQPQSCSDYKDYVSSSLVKRYTTIPKYRYYSGCGRSGSDPITGAPAPTPATDAVSGGELAASPALPPAGNPDDVSGTNNQVDGVDESDMVKVDPVTGTVFIAHSKYVLIADAYPPQNLSMLKQIDMKARVVDLLYDETKKYLTVITQYQNPTIYFADTAPVRGSPVIAIDSLVAPSPVKPETIITFFDVSANLGDSVPGSVTPPADPVMLKQINLDGYYQTSRRIANRVHMVTRHQLDPIELTSDPEFIKLNGEFYQAISNANCNVADGIPAPDYLETDPGVIAAKQNLSAKIINVVAALDVNVFLPQAKMNAANTTTGQTDIPNFLQCKDVYHPEVKSQLGMQVVSSMDTDGENVAASGIMNNSWLTYVSKDSLYISENSNFWWWGNAESRINQTAIHRFSISSTRPIYLATGEVDGRANNSYNFSDYNGFLRIATTQIDITPATAETPWQRSVKNHLTILADDNIGNLNVVGELRDLAPGESIRSVRFMGDRGFMVTFRNVDPLFTFDLSDPINPILKAELKIPGFSTYMHPYDDTHLLTIGRDGGENGLGTGNDMQLQLIDVSDMAKPFVVPGSQYSPNLPSGYSWSSAAYDSHAFTFYKPANLLIIPMQIYASDPTQSFSGMMAFNVSLSTGITEIDRVDHADLAKQYYCDTKGVASGFQWACANNSYIYWASPRRSIVMTDATNIYMYTISDMGMKVGQISDRYLPIGNLIFPPQVYPWYEVGIADSAGSGGSVPAL